MNPKEKAQELVDKYYNQVESKGCAINCALIAVDEILDKDGFNNDYWKEVKYEIEKL